MEGNFVKIVVKVEIRVLLNEEGGFDPYKMERLSMVLSNLVNSGAKILIVSSGAIFLGSKKLGLDGQPEGLIDKQAVAAVGQAELMKLYRRYFEGYNQTVAQVLLTGDIFVDPEKSGNARNTLIHLLEQGVIPVINENDSVSTEDIELNDNYYLVRAVAGLTGAHLLLIKAKKPDTYILLGGSPEAGPRFIHEKELIDEVAAVERVMPGEAFREYAFPATLHKVLLEA
ncbi:MAG: hypothetical protein J7K46_06370 [Bacteroidales bacterium]|nr:hypothetical protein [Bacteroidales bacterium]